MRIAYFDCYAGISGDMTLGALLAAGADEAALRERLAALPLSAYELKVERVTKRGIAATDVTVNVTGGQSERRLTDIVDMLSSGPLPERVTRNSILVFERLAEAEARVHGCEIDHVHFHEVGAVDAIVDIVGASICLDLLGVEKVMAGPLPVPRGFVESAHGTLPIPAPATVELLRGVPVRGVDLDGELVTPTGAAIVKALAVEFGPSPEFIVDAVGYGAGKRDYGFPNTLRVMIGEGQDEVYPVTERMVVLETNLDDLNPQLYDSVMDSLFAAGARDVFLAPIQMKKNRPATLLSVLCDPDRKSAMLSILFAETSTLGVRLQEVGRACLERSWATVQTAYGPIRVKIGSLGPRTVNASPEYEDCRAAATEHNVPVKAVYEAAAAAFGSTA